MSTHLLVVVVSRGPLPSSLAAGVSATRGGDRGLPELGHEGQILLVHPSLVLGRLRRLAARRSVGSEGAAGSKPLAMLTTPHTHCGMGQLVLPGVLAVRGDVAGSTALGTEGGVGDAAWLRILPGTKDPRDRRCIRLEWCFVV